MWFPQERLEKVGGVEALTPERYLFFCRVHPFMKGKLHVVAGAIFAEPGSRPRRHAERGHGPSTGDPMLCAPWSFAGLPAISLPSGLARDGLPLAIQLVSEGEPRLLAVAAWCEAMLGFSGTPPEPN